MKIDSHQHFWHINTKDYGWMDDSMSVIRRDFLPEQLLPELKSIGFDGSIAVQARQSWEETNWLLQLADRHPEIKGVVGWVDLQSEKVEKQLEAFAAHPKAVGVRHVIHDEVEDDFMLRPAFVRGLKLLLNYRLVYDLLLFPRHLPNALKLVEQFDPDQSFVLDHIAKPLIKDRVLSPWNEHIRKLAAFPSVYCKVSGLVTEADWQNWHPDELKPYLDTIFEAFGPERILIGSDWPVCLLAGSYSRVMGVVLDYIAALPANEKALVTGGTAEKVYLSKKG